MTAGVEQQPVHAPGAGHARVYLSLVALALVSAPRCFRVAMYSCAAADRTCPGGTSRFSSLADALVARAPAALMASSVTVLRFMPPPFRVLSAYRLSAVLGSSRPNLQRTAWPAAQRGRSGAEDVLQRRQVERNPLFGKVSRPSGIGYSGLTASVGGAARHACFGDLIRG
jgi:hypothetical protein